ncbi:MAG: hypothetical protein H0X33_13210 [Taibaiella sp.]|nr:hypothetical protein [Taibaiella sp.]
MPAAQAFVAADLGIYLGAQSAKSTAAAALKGAIAFTKFENTPEIEMVNGVPMLGPTGFYMQQSIGTAVKTTQSAEGWVSLDLFPAMILGAFMTKGVSSGTAAFVHPYSQIAKNSGLPYLTIGMVYGESTTPGTGIAGGVHIIRDARLTQFKYTISSLDAIKFTAQWMGLNMSGGTGQTFTPPASIVGIFPNPNGAGNTYTFPSFIPSTVCVNTIDVEWNATAVQTPPCLGSGEHGDTLITQAGWTLTFKMQMDVNSIKAYNQILNKADTLAASNTLGFTAGLKQGAFSFLANSDTLVPTTSTPFSLGASFPSLQWSAPKISNESPSELTIVAKSFSNDVTHTVTNATAGGSMTI